MPWSPTKSSQKWPCQNCVQKIVQKVEHRTRLEPNAGYQQVIANGVIEAKEASYPVWWMDQLFFWAGPDLYWKICETSFLEAQKKFGMETTVPSDESPEKKE